MEKIDDKADDPLKYLDPLTLAKVRGLELQARPVPLRYGERPARPPRRSEPLDDPATIRRRMRERMKEDD